MSIQIIIPLHILDSHKVPAGHNLLDLDAGSSHRDDEDLIVPFGEVGYIKSALHIIAGAVISSAL